MQTGINCSKLFNNQIDLQQARLLLSVPSLITQGLLRYEDKFILEKPTIQQEKFFCHCLYYPL